MYILTFKNDLRIGETNMNMYTYC